MAIQERGGCAIWGRRQEPMERCGRCGTAPKPSPNGSFVVGSGHQNSTHRLREASGHFGDILDLNNPEAATEGSLQSS